MPHTDITTADLALHIAEENRRQIQRSQVSIALLVKAAARYLDYTRHGEDLDYMGFAERAAVERALHGEAT